MASIVPHVLDALIGNSKGEQKDKYEKLKEQENDIQTAVLYSSSTNLTDDVRWQINALFHLDDAQNPLAQTLRICQEIHDNAVPKSSYPKEVSKLMDGEQSLELIDYGKTCYSNGFGQGSNVNQDFKAIQNAESELAKKKVLDQNLIRERGFNNKTLAAALDDRFDIENDNTEKLSHSFKEGARVAANVRYVIEALEKSSSTVSDLNVGQIQLAAMFLDGVASDSVQYDNMDQSIAEFAHDNKQKYGFNDDGIGKLTDAMCKFQDACTEGPGRLEENSLAQAFYVSHQLDLLRYKDKSMQYIAAQVKPKIEKVAGQEQCSSLIKRSEMVISQTSDQEFLGGSEELCKKITNAHKEASNQELAEAADLKKAM